MPARRLPRLKGETPETLGIPMFLGVVSLECENALKKYFIFS